MENIRKRALSILLSLIVTTSAFSGSILAVDVDSSTESVCIKAATGELVEISEEDLQSQMDISESEALEVARSFLKDALTFGDVAWDEDTAVVAVRKLYDESEESRVTAYSFE